MQYKNLSYRTAVILSLSISLLLNLLFLITFLYGRDAGFPEGEGPGRPSFSIRWMSIHITANFLIAFLLYILNFKILKSPVPGRKRLLTGILATIAATFVLSYIFSNIQLLLVDATPYPKHFIRGGMMRDFFIALIVMFSTQLIYLSARNQQTALENEALLSENMRARFEVLKNQVDPHFLFNSLNTLNSLIKIDADKAQDYVQQLSSVFRYTLQHKEIITLEEELRFTRSYCHLMEIRYGDGLRLEFRIDPLLEKNYIIPFSLQILVENAIKHNVVSHRQPLTITFATGNDQTISISNPIQAKKEAEEGEGIGLANLSERYRLKWQRDIIIKQDNGIFSVEIPLKDTKEK